MTRDEIGLEVEFRGGEDGKSPFTHHFHARCLAAWEDELSASLAGNGAASNGLHGHGGNGTIPDRERDHTQPRGTG
jgi:hypothetical protein